MNLERLNEKVSVLLEQCCDMQLLIEFKDIRYSESFKLKQLYQRTYLNFKQRRRFLAVSYCKNSEEALQNLYEVESLEF